MKEKVDTESERYNNDNNSHKFEELLELTSTLRKHQEEEALLFERGHEQRRELNINAKYLESLITKRDDMEGIVNSGDINEGIKQKISDSAQILKKLDFEYSECHQLLNEALNIMNGSQITAMDVQQLEINVSDIQQQVNQLEQERDKLLQSVDSKLGFYKKRAEGVAKKKDAAKQRLDGLKQESREMRTEIMLSIMQDISHEGRLYSIYFNFK